MNTNSPILTAAQAEAVYSAMCALNNVGATLLTHMMCGRYFVQVMEYRNGRIVVDRGDKIEIHADQNEFATAYGLNADAPATAGAAS